MFIDNGILKKIQDCNSIVDLVNFMNINKNMILAFKSEVFAIIDKTNKDYNFPQIDVSFIKHFFYDKKTVSEDDYDFLNFYINNTYLYLNIYLKNMHTDHLKDYYNSLNSSNEALVLLLLTKDNIQTFEKYNEQFADIYKHMERSLYEKLLDLYVPCENPEEVIKEITDSHVTLGTLLSISFNENEFTKAVYQSNVQIKSISIEALTLFKYISDIYSNEATKFNTFKKLHYIETKAIPLQDKVEIIEQRYDKYLKDETIDLIYRVLMIFNQDGVDVNLHNFVLSVHQDYQINDKIIIAFLKDVLEISYEHNDAYHYDRSAQAIELISNTNVNNIKKIEDNPSNESFIYTPEDGILYATEAYKKDSVVMHDAQHNIYKAYKNYKTREDKIDSQITKATQGMKNVLIGDVKTEIIEGKKFSAIGLLKQILGTAAVFSFGPIQGVVLLVTRYALKKKTTISERRKIILELETELDMINEKIEDARGDGNKQAKYALMRTRIELTNAIKRIKYGLEADERSIQTAKATIKNIRSSL